MRISSWTLTLTLCVAASTAAVAEPPKAEDVIELDWGATPHVSHLDSLYFAGQVDAEGLERAKESGVAIVINMRGPDEHDWDEAAAAEALGLIYVSVPVTGSSFDPAAFEKIESLVAEHSDEKILLHCGSSNRVGGWLATHLVETEGMGLDDALEVGRAAGITSSGIEKRTRDYVETRKASH